MTTLTIELSFETFTRLSEQAKGFGITPEELARSLIQEFLRLPEDEFKRRIEFSRWLDKTIEEHHDMFQRLADS